MDILNIKKQIEEDISRVRTLNDLENISKKYLGRKGEITRFFDEIKNFSSKQRAEKGREGNELKNWLITQIESKRQMFKKGGEESKYKKDIDITQPGEKIERGNLSLITQMKNEIEMFFLSMGFDIAEGPNVETEFYNFDALNIPEYHPARDIQDTFWLKEKGINKEKLLLRTHTSPVQIRYMREHKPPLKMITIGNTFRHEAIDASHEAQFCQMEGLAVDKNISLANLKDVVENFLRHFFGKKMAIQWRPGYFPFVEPGVEVDMECLMCRGKGCPVCKNSGWLEVMGAGMVHPYVLKSGGIDPHKWQGFAFGIGIDRLVMLRHCITDIRVFRGGQSPKIDF